MREAPAMPIIEGLLARGATVQAYDPEATHGRARASSAARSRYARQAATTRSTGADALAIVTEWNEFREPDFAQMQQADEAAGGLRRPQHLRPEQMRALGFTYFSIGRP